MASTAGATYDAWDAQLAACRTARDGVAARIQSALGGAAAGTVSLDDATAGGLEAQASALIGDMHSLAGQSAPPTASVCDAPTVTITHQPPDPTRATSATFAFTTDDPAHPGTALTTTCSLDGRPDQPCTSPVTYAHLTDGRHTFTVAARDPAGNVGSASFDFTVDTTRPTCTVTATVHGPPRQLHLRVEDGGSGLESIGNIASRNGTVEVGAFTPGTRQPVAVTVTKAHETRLARLIFDLTGFSLEPTRWSFDASDAAGNTAHCAGSLG